MMLSTPGQVCSGQIDFLGYCYLIAMVMVRPGEGNGSCGMCRAEMCRAKTCRAAHVFNSMDVRAHDKHGLSPTVFSF